MANPRPTDEAIIAGIADALPVGVWVARAPGGEFVYANGTFRDIMGVGPRADVAAGEYAEPYSIHDREGNLYPEDRMPFVRALVARAIVMVDDIVIHRPDGGRVNIRAYARPVFDNDTITHVVIAFFDITREVHAERLRAESELRMRRAQRMDSIGTLAGGIAHDFNNLLGAIRTLTDVLREGEHNAERKRDLDSIAAAAESGAQLTRALLGFAGRGKNLAAPIAINDVVLAVIDIFGRAVSPRLEIVTELDARREVLGDRSQLQQVVMNLMINACDAIVDTGRVTVRTKDEDDGTRTILEIEDDGPGVPPELRERIFEPYFSTKSGATHGTVGLGLATAYGIVEAHGGRIDVLDGVKGGARFRVELPAIDADDAAERTNRRGQLRRGEGLVLVVDDQPALQIAARRGLECAGYSVVTAGDGLVALEVFRERRAEIVAVLLDMNMPRLDGRGTFTALREMAPDVRILLMTGYALNEEVQALLHHGGAGFIAKPFGFVELAAAVYGLLKS